MLEVSGLTYRYRHGDTPALEGVSLSAARGRILGLLGPNGAGKSTLVAHIAGLIAPTEGRITVNGQPLAQARRADPTRIAIAPQEFAFYPALSVLENLRCFAQANRLAGAQARAAVDRALLLGRLEDHARVLASRLSGGYRRRLNFAIAQLAQPDLIVLDEPTVGVDPASRAFLLDAVRALAAAGAAVIYTSHYMEEIESIADEVAILHHGRLLRHAPLDTLLGASASHLAIQLDAPPAAPLLGQLEACGALRVDGRRIVLDLAPGTKASQAIARVEASGATITGLHSGQRRLEDVFTQLTREAPCSPP